MIIRLLIIRLIIITDKNVIVMMMIIYWTHIVIGFVLSGILWVIFFILNNFMKILQFYPYYGKEFGYIKLSRSWQIENGRKRLNLDTPTPGATQLLPTLINNNLSP